MANPKSQQYEVIKNGPLCLDKYCADIVPFGQGFNKKNSPMLGGAISNVFSKADSNKKNYYSDGKNEMWTEDGHIIVNGNDFGTIENKKFIVDDIFLDNVKLTKDNCLDYHNENNYILKDNNNITVKVNGILLNSITYNPNSYYKILELKSGFYYLEYTRNYNANLTFDVSLRLANNSESDLYNDIILSNVPISVEDKIRIEFGQVENNGNTKLYLYIACLNKEYEFSDDFYFHEKLTTHGYYDPPSYDLTIKNAGGYRYHSLLEINLDALEVKNVLLSYATKSGSTAVIYLFFPVVTFNRISIIYFRVVINIVSHEASFPYYNFTRYISSYGNYIDSPIPLLKSVIDVYSETSPTDKYTFDIDASSEKLITNRSDNVNDDSDYEKDIYFNKIFIAFSKNNYDNVCQFHHVLYNFVDNNVKYIQTADFQGYSKSIIETNENTYFIGGIYNLDGSIKVPHFDSPSRSNYVNYKNDNSNWGLLLDENQLPQAISYSTRDIPATSTYYNDKYINDTLGVVITPWNSIETSMPVNLSDNVVYVDKGGIWKEIKIVDGVDISLIGDFILINTISKYNAIQISTKSKTRWAVDWNNRVISTNLYTQFTKGAYLSNSYSFRINSAINANQNIVSDIPSSFMNIIGLYLYSNSTVDANTLYGIFFTNIMPLCSRNSDFPIEIYNEDTSVTNYYLSIHTIYDSSDDIIKTNSYIDSIYSGTEWPMGNITYYNPTILANFNITFQDLAYISYDDEIYILHYITDGKFILLYRYDTNIENIDGFFAVQGQTYIIRNSKLYNYTIQNEAIQLSNFICDITGLKYLTFTPSMAYFWSDVDSSIYGFTADNIIKKLYTATDINYINNAIYYPSCDITVFVTNLGILCYHTDLGIFIIGQSLDNNEYTEGKVFLQSEGYITYSDNESVSYFTFWFPDNDTWTKNDIILATKFYGLGSNLISITDTWYFRLFADKNLYKQMNISRSGKLKLSIDALTDQGLSTETKEIDIKDSDWDKLTDTLYIRYQPKLQRGVGISLNVDSPFAIGYLGLGNIAETTQMSRPSMQV